MSKSPFTSWRSGARERRKVYTEGEVRLPRQRIWPILLGVRSFLNWWGKLGAGWIWGEGRDKGGGSAYFGGNVLGES